MITEKNSCIDFLKGIACIVVIFLHCPFPTWIGEAIIYGMRFSVPIFFMVSGYFSYFKDVEWIKRKIKSIFKITIGTELFYGIWTFIRECLINKGSPHSILNFGNPVKILLCGTFFNGTLWYLYAIFWTWVIFYFAKKKKIFSKLYFLIPLLLLFQIAGRYYCQNHYDITKYVFLFCNAIAFGLPFTLLGSFIACHREKLLQYFKVKQSILLFLLGGVFLVMEYVFSRQYMDLHTSTVFIVVGMFLFALNHPQIHIKILKPMVYIGNKLYMWVYLSHMFFISLVGVLACYLELKGLLFEWLQPLLVCILSCGAAMIIDRIKDRMKEGDKKWKNR